MSRVLAKILPLDLLLLIFLFQSCQVRGAVSEVEILGDRIVDEHSEVRLNCTAKCTNGSCVYSWPTTGGLSTTASSNVLVAKDVRRRPGDAKYQVTCEVRDNSGQNSRTISLTVRYGPDSVSINTASPVTVQEGHAFPEVTCTAVNCSLSCDVVWLKGSVTEASTGVLFDKTKLASRSQAGTYTCKATNNGKKTPTSATRSLDLIVNYPPDVSVSWNSGTRKLTCLADGVPAVYDFEKWKQNLNNVEIRELDGNLSGNTLSYAFADMSYMDRGEYTCRVKNGITPTSSTDAWISRSKPIDPDDKPTIVSYQKTYNVSKGASLPIVLDVYAQPFLSEGGVTLLDNSSESISGGDVGISISKATVAVKFYSKEVNVVGQTVTASLSSVQEGHFGNLKVKLANGHGEESCDITLYPEGPPDPPVDLRVDATSHDKVTLTFRSGFYNGADQTFVVEYKSGAQGSSWVNGSSVEAGIKKNVSLSSTIAGLEPGTFYMFRSYGYNMYNRSDYAEVVVNATTIEAPQSLDVLIGGSVGGSLAIFIVIIVVIVICRRRRKKSKDDRKDSSAMYGKGQSTDEEPQNALPGSGRDNSTYVTDEPAYENTLIKNRGPAESNQGTEGNTGKAKEEPIYSNQQKEGVIAANVGVPDEKVPNDDNLVAMEGYLDLQNGGPVVEEAYVTKGGTSRDIRNDASEEEPYLNMDDIKPAGMPFPQAKYVIETTPQYSNVSKQIGLLDTDKDTADNQDSPYLDMNVIQSPKMSAKWPGAAKGHRYTKPKGPQSTDGMYVSMGVGKGPAGTSKLKAGPTGGRQYQNIHVGSKMDQGVSMDQDPSVMPNMHQRDSIPSFHAPPPPGSLHQEEVYENTNLVNA